MAIPEQLHVFAESSIPTLQTVAAIITDKVDQKQQEAQLLLRDRALFRVIKCFAIVTQGHWKWYYSKAWVSFPIHIP